MSDEIEIRAVKAQGAGGQNVNKVSTAIHLRFDIRASSLPDEIKTRLLRLKDHRITKDGIIVIKAQQFRTQEKNKADALDRLQHLIRSVTVRRKKRRPTRPGVMTIQKRLDGKTQQGRIKTLRKKIKPNANGDAL